MKKSLLLAACAAVAMMMTGCYFCGDPIDESCVGSSHATGDEVVPAGMTFVQPLILPSKDAFVPRFEALARLSNITGVGNSLEDATANAIKVAKETADCDYVVVVNKQVETKTHPHWCWFLSTTNFTVVIDAIPVKLKALDRVDAPVAEVAAKTEVAPVNQDAGMIKLSDIQVQINAKGESADNAAVIYPVK